jgi:beta-glucosidase/6-phospho-beta-glucosidase/beta-galactosidase
MQDWERYAALVFDTFGDRVKHWITHNEVSLSRFKEGSQRSS